jgi:D-glycerate 3-kinase
MDGSIDTAWFNAFLAGEGLPSSFVEVAERMYTPFARQVIQWRAAQNAPLVLGVNGAQGTGKSTLAAWLGQYLLHEAGLRCAILSIDDLYLTRAQRLALSQEVHPLFATRGVPGTHDLLLGMDTLDHLLAGQEVPLPRFNKAVDDRVPLATWPRIVSPVDVVIVEGWCVGAQPEADGALERPINALEQGEDAHGLWRGYVNAQLAGPYRELFDRMDHLVMLKAPDFDAVHGWRAEQEAKLLQRVRLAGESDAGVMDAPSLKRFMMHYERLTHWMLEEMPDRADVCWTLAADHTISGVSGIASY